MTVSLIFCQSQNGFIGNENKLLFSIPADMRYFREQTEHKIVLMGRRTWESIPEKFRPLPNRHNTVVTTRPLVEPNVRTINNETDLLEYLDYYSKLPNIKLFVIGGESIYNAALPFADEIHCTMVYEDRQGDTKAPIINYDEWAVVSNTGDQRHVDLIFSFIVLKRKHHGTHDPRNK